MNNIKHIFFDLDHTLWDFDKNSELALQQIFNEQKIELNFQKFINTYVPINLKYWELYQNEQVSKQDLRYGRLKDTFDSLNFEISDSIINQMSEDYLSYLPNNNYLIDGAIEILEYLQPNYELHIITNGFKEVQAQKLEQSNIHQYFNVVVTSESVGLKKSNPKVFEFALQEANAKAEESVLIGDNFEADVKGAFACGIFPVHFTNETNPEKNNFLTISNLNELKQHFKKSPFV